MLNLKTFFHRAIEGLFSQEACDEALIDKLAPPATAEKS